MQEKGISNKVTEAWSLDDLWVSINGTEICDIDFVGYEAIFGGCNIPATLSFIDSYGLTTGDVDKAANIGIGGLVDLGFTTSTGCTYEDQFVITKVTTENNAKNQKLVKIDMEDTETRNMKGAFVSKGYPGKKFSEAMEEHMQTIGNDAHQSKRKLEVVANDEEKKLNMVVPAHMDFYTFLNKEMKDKGYSYLKDKTTEYLVHDKFRLFDKLKGFGDTFEFDTNYFSFNRIVQFNVEGYNVDAIMKSFPIANTSIDLVTNNSEDSKDGIDSKISQKKPSDEVSTETSGVKVADLANQGQGSKQGHKVANEQQYFNALSNAQKCSIWIPGRVDNMIGRKVTTIFPKPNYYAGTDDDKIFSGEWEVYMVRDKIIGMYYMQEMFLRRPGGSNK